MKNDVVRWNVHSPNFKIDSDNEENNGEIIQNIYGYNNDTDPIATQTKLHNDWTFFKNFEARKRCHTSSFTTNCDNNENKIETENKKFVILVNQSKIPHLSSSSGHVQCAASKAKSELKLNLCSCTYSNLTSKHLQNNSLHRTVRGLNLSKFIYFCLQVYCLNFLCNISVGVVSSTSVNNVVAAQSLVYHQEDYHSNRPSIEEYSSESSNQYTHTWAVHIPKGDSGLANDVAKSHGFVNLGKIFDDHYHFAHHKVSKRSVSPALTHHKRLTEDSRVHWAEQQIAKSRGKRDFIRMRPSRTSSRTLSLVDAIPLSDPKWSQMWYLNRGGGLDMNVIPAWKQGITGKGIVVTILDDGLESDHPDIEHNYDAKASYDVNSHDDDPMPHYDMTDSNRHGTRCAGEVAATANNSICAVGIAFGASVGGVRMLDGDVTDAVEARSLSLNPQHIDIYSASWGPDDDGKTVDGPGELASRAFIEGVTKGRNGKGSIFIWASGNGGRELDNCNCDGYTNSIWTLSISSATEEGNVPWYSEKCSSTLATTYSSGGQNEKQVVTTDLHHSCTVSHTGTSASAPLAAGIAALVLESNQNLTWRDLQHIVVRTAKPANLRDQTWSKNGVGRRISHSFGYGLMDAAAMVQTARNWKTVPEQQRCEINAPHVDKVIPPRGSITLQLTVKHCSSVNYLEHVQAKITLTSQRRGDIQLYLKSPAGTKVTLLTSRIHDASRSGFNQWPFMSVHTWGESPHGNWQLEIHNEGHYMGNAMLREWSLIFYGTTHPIEPNDPISIPRAASSENTTTNSSSTSAMTNLHQVYSPQYPLISLNNFGVDGSSFISHKMPLRLPPNKSVYVAAGSANNPINAAGNGYNKKQSQKLQSYQQVSATYGVILGSQNKNKNKIGKGKSSEAKGNKSSNNGKLSKKDPTLTSATSNTKNKYYRLSQQQQQGSGNKSNTKFQIVTSSQRPKPSSIQSNDRHSGKQDAFKVIGDLLPLEHIDPPMKNKSLETLSFAKLSVKATKHVKESLGSLHSHEKLTNSDQRIPKMFERYEKIQAIFPEFQPYQGPKDTVPSEMITSTRKHFPTFEAASDKSIDISFSSTFKPSTLFGGSKPSRENSKKTSQRLTVEQNHQNLKKKEKQASLATSSIGDAASSSSIIVTQRPGSGSEANTFDRKIGNASEGQITQWDLIFYGTESPAQPDDPVQISSGQLSPYGKQMDHNHLDFDQDSPNGQWRNEEQVGEYSHMSSDRTNTACLKATIDQRCLVCAFPTFIYEGRCYQKCPTHTYVLHKNVLAASSDNDIQEIPIVNQDEPLQSVERRRSARQEIDETNPSVAETKLACVACDKSCLRCYGPRNSECSTCYAGSQLHVDLLTNETYCYVFAERSSGNSQESVKTESQNSVFMFLVMIVPAIIVISCLVGTVLTKNVAFPWSRNDGRNYVYDRLALLSVFEEGQVEQVDQEAETEDEESAEEEELTFGQEKPHQNVVIDSINANTSKKISS